MNRTPLASTTPGASRQDQRLAAADEWQPRAPTIPASCPPRRAAGFTLIETMVVVAIAGILSSIAVPSFVGQLQKVRRSDALLSMLQVQSAQERYRVNSTRYGSLAEIGVAAVSTARHYALQSTAASAEGYEVVATATGSQAGDAACRHLKLSAVGGNPAFASGPDASVGNTDADNRKCWML